MKVLVGSVFAWRDEIQLSAESQGKRNDGNVAVSIDLSGKTSDRLKLMRKLEVAAEKMGFAVVWPKVMQCPSCGRIEEATKSLKKKCRGCNPSRKFVALG